MASPASVSETSRPRLLVIDGGAAHDVFEVLDLADGIARVRSPFLFEVGEEIEVRIELAGRTAEATARVLAHVGPEEDRITELQITDWSGE